MATHILCRTHQPQCGSPELKHSPQVPYCSHDSMGTWVTWKHMKGSGSQCSITIITRCTKRSFWVCVSQWNAHSVTHQQINYLVQTFPFPFITQKQTKTMSSLCRIWYYNNVNVLCWPDVRDDVPQMFGCTVSLYVNVWDLCQLHRQLLPSS